MIWPFGPRKTKRDEHVTALEQKARAGEIALVNGINRLDSRRRILAALNDVDRVSEEALDQLRGHDA